MKFFLVGFMGSGKSTVGKMVADKLGWDFVDTDKMVEAQCGKSIVSVYGTDGEAVFRKLERDALLHIKVHTNNAIIATGGGMPIFSDNMSLMNTMGITIYLKCTPELLFERLKDNTVLRPLIAGDEDLNKMINCLLSKREPSYKLSTHIVKIDNSDTPDSVCEKICKLFEKRCPDKK